MGRQCFFTGKKTSFGKTRAWRGQAVAKGGFGLKPTGISPRLFRPNLQEVTALVDGRARRVKASAAAIRSGLVIKPLKRKYGYTRQQKAAAAAAAKA
jgi:large subunit ribosomal protein L28